MKKLFIVVLLIFILSLSNSAVCAKDFNDISSTHWAFEYVDYLSDNGIINGYEVNTFRPS